VVGGELLGRPDIDAAGGVDTPDALRVEADLGSQTAPQWTPCSPSPSPSSAEKSQVIIDQPDDDLDNRFIYQEVVRQIAEVSQHRQVIVPTHNANIPVLGDAELVLALEASTGRGATIASGGLDDPTVAETARNILEGGGRGVHSPSPPLRPTMSVRRTPTHNAVATGIGPGRP
jgi:hypothetical protein